MPVDNRHVVLIVYIVKTNRMSGGPGGAWQSVAELRKARGGRHSVRFMKFAECTLPPSSLTRNTTPQWTVEVGCPDAEEAWKLPMAMNQSPSPYPQAQPLPLPLHQTPSQPPPSQLQLQSQLHQAPPTTPLSDASSATGTSNSRKRRASGATSSRGVANLTPEQLAKKRANDREAQRAIRERTRNQIESLEKRIKELESQQPFQELQNVMRQRDAVQAENEDLRRRLSSVLAIVQPAPNGQGLSGAYSTIRTPSGHDSLRTVDRTTSLTLNRNSSRRSSAKSSPSSAAGAASVSTSAAEPLRTQ
ncbi:hypothetical protein LTR28_004108 [Elasticomyces elasticus]|nr:hypothetical protein LTR28_004108 [Elasticomyces elasticus]